MLHKEKPISSNCQSRQKQPSLKGARKESECPTMWAGVLLAQEHFNLKIRSEKRQIAVAMEKEAIRSLGFFS